MRAKNKKDKNKQRRVALDIAMACIMLISLLGFMLLSNRYMAAIYAFSLLIAFYVVIWNKDL